VTRGLEAREVWHDAEERVDELLRVAAQEQYTNRLVGVSGYIFWVEIDEEDFAAVFELALDVRHKEVVAGNAGRGVPEVCP
jgi:hypothetical protein